MGVIANYTWIVRRARRGRRWSGGLLLLLLLGAAVPARAQEGLATNGARCPGYYLSPQERLGINVAREAGKEITDYAVRGLGAGWYLDYTWHDTPAHPATTAPPGQMHYLPMVRPIRFERAQQAGRLAADLTARLAPALANNPGATWLLGNEPDNWAQDRQFPADYARFYHTAYTTIKALDPTAQVAMAAVTAVTPLRLRYLDQILAAYQRRYGTPLPTDRWTVHIYLLPEGPAPDTGFDNRAATDTAPAWGIGVPPGLDAYRAEGLFFTQDQHDDLALFAAQILRFRTWLADRGYRDKPLYLTEYGILLSPHHGFDDGRVQAFLLGSLAWLAGARHPATGLPADDNRLVQRWAWFSLNFYAFDPTPGREHGLAGLNGNLFDHGSGAITPLGVAFAAYGERLHTRTVDLAVSRAGPSAPGTPATITVTNRGDATATGFRLRLFAGTVPLRTVTIDQPLLPHCGNRVTLPIHWQWTPAGDPLPLRVQLLPIAGQVDYDPVDNGLTISWGDGRAVRTVGR